MNRVNWNLGQLSRKTYFICFRWLIDWVYSVLFSFGATQSITRYQHRYTTCHICNLSRNFGYPTPQRAYTSGGD